MNLLSDPWIPGRRASGRVGLIKPSQVTENIEVDPVVGISIPRADLSCALFEFLTGLFQNVAAPQNRREWRAFSDQPPSPEALEQLLAPLAPAFELEGDGPRFCQDLDMPLTDERPADYLLIEVAGSQGHFVKTDGHFGLCEPCAAAALYTLQAYAPPGGRGHLTGIRGGGPLVTAVVPDPHVDPDRQTLWHTCWSNVLRVDEWRSLTFDEPCAQATADIFPWLGATRTSERVTTPDDVSSLQVYWGMPRRIRLDFSHTEIGRCGVCNRDGRLVTRYFTRPKGVRYAGAWRHPLTPYREEADGTPIARHPNPGGVGYREWAALFFGSDADGIQPAATVIGARNRGVGNMNRALLWAYGYDMDKMKSRCWYEARMPVFQLAHDELESVRSAVWDLVTSSQHVAANLRHSVKKAWFRHLDDTKKKASLAAVMQAYWDRTEGPFFALVEDLVVAHGDETTVLPTCWTWFDVITQASTELFAVWCHAEDNSEPARVAMAEIDLRKFNHKKAITGSLRIDTRRAQARGGPA